MLRSGDFVSPAWNDHVPHFTKPPLTYWGIAGGIALLGWNEWGVRLANAFAFAATIVVVSALAKQTSPDRPWLPPVLYATSLFPFVAANVVSTDTLLNLWESVAVLGFLRWWTGHRSPRGSGSLLLMWLGFGLAFLTKGPPGMLPLAAIVTFVWLAEGKRTAGQLFHWRGLLLFTAVALFWYLIVVVKNPGLLTYFIRDEVIGRVSSGHFHRNPQWYGSLLMYLPTLLLGTLPWTLVWLPRTRGVRGSLLSRTWWQTALKQEPLQVFLLLWIFIPLAVFFISRSRLPLYILPLFVPIALLTAKLPIANRSAFLLDRRFLAGWVLSLLALKVGVAHYSTDKDVRPMAQAIKASVSPLPREIVFVDVEPRWGLSLYLGCEIEHATSGEGKSDHQHPEKGLLAELAQGEALTLLGIKEKQWPQMLSLLEPQGFSPRKVGVYKDYLFVDVRKQFNAPTQTPASPGSDLSP